MSTSHTLGIMKTLMLLLGIFTAATEASGWRAIIEKDVSQREFSGRSGEHIRLTFQPTTNPSSLYGDVFIYKFRNLDAINSTIPRYVRLTFTVFNLPEGQAVLKIYDGADINGPMTIFTANDRPFYQSLQPQVYMMLKFYDVTNHHKPPEFDGFVTFTREYRGTWRKNYPPGDGLGWRDRFLPTTAYCKSLRKLREGGSSGCVAHHANRYPHDCYWRLHLEKEVKLVIGWDRLSMMIVDKHFTVTNGAEAELAQFNPKSLEPRVIRRGAGHRPRVLMEFSGKNFHIHLFFWLVNYDVAFGYHEDFDTAVELLERELERKVTPDCPFKRCADATCMMHWDACEDRYKGTDGSCDEALSPQMDSRCGTQCYNVEWDACDTIKDCGGGQDESCTKYKKEKDKTTKNKGTKVQDDDDVSQKGLKKPVIIGIICGCVLLMFCIAVGACRWCLARSMQLCADIANSISECFSCCKTSCCNAVDSWKTCCQDCCQGCCNQCQTCCQNSVNQCHNCCRRAPQQPRAHHASDVLDPGTPPPVFDPAWTTDLPAVIYTAPENPPASHIQHTDIEPPSYTTVVARVPDVPSSPARQATPGAITRQPGRGTDFRAPMLEGVAPPPSYSTVAPSVPTPRANTSPGRAGTVRPVGYRQPDRARPTDQSTNRLRQGNTSEPPPSYDSVWN